MIYELLTINPTTLESLLAFLKPYLERSFSEPSKPESNRGAPRKYSRWLVIALGMIGSITKYTWEEYVDQLQPLAGLINSFNIYESDDVPGKTTIYNGYRNLSATRIKSLTAQFGKEVAEFDRVAIDSSGFKLKLGKIWNLISYEAGKLKRTSKLFYKFHIIVDTATKSILAINWSKSPDHDYPVGDHLVRKLGSRVLEGIRYFFGDKAYEGPELRAYLKQSNIRLLVEPKINAVDNGQNSDRDRDVRLAQNSKGLWKTTFNYGKKQIVENVFGEIKDKLELNSRKRTILKRQLLLHFLMYNVNICLQAQKNGR